MLTIKYTDKQRDQKCRTAVCRVETKGRASATGGKSGKTFRKHIPSSLDPFHLIKMVKRTASANNDTRQVPRFT